jgi:hypothetical protein
MGGRSPIDVLICRIYSTHSAYGLFEKLYVNFKVDACALQEMTKTKHARNKMQHYKRTKSLTPLRKRQFDFLGQVEV